MGSICFCEIYVNFNQLKKYVNKYILENELLILFKWYSLICHETIQNGYYNLINF